MGKTITTREHLLAQAAQIFVEKGYHKATTREICIAAGTNITAIHYYFKNKEGLYRAIFEEPFVHVPDPKLDVSKLLDLPLHTAMEEFYKILLRPFIVINSSHSPDRHKLFRYIHELIAREQFEPTKLINDLILRPVHEIHIPLNEFLCCRLSVPLVDEEIHRLAFALIGLGFAFIHPRHIIKHLAPSLIDDKGMSEKIYHRLADFACAIINSEIERNKKSQD